MKKVKLTLTIAFVVLNTMAFGSEPPPTIKDVAELFLWSKENDKPLEFVSILESKKGLALVAFSKKKKEGLYLTTYLLPSGATEYKLFDHGFSEKIDFGDDILRYVNRIEYAEDHDVLMYMYMPTGILSHSLPLREAFSSLKQKSEQVGAGQPDKPPVKL